MQKLIQPHLAETLSHVGKIWRSTRQIADDHAGSKDANPRAIFNRLQNLRAKRLVHQRMVGRARFWRLAP